ncbi:MAG: aldo/keto reductase, partial [Armatimonadota bacterium]
MNYQPDPDRYDAIEYRRCGRSGLHLPAISLGLWHNFGGVDVFETGRAMVRRAFDRGVTHFDLANNYGPPPGSAEENFGKMMALDLRPFRDELVISSKAGYRMWPGPYGEWGSRKYLIASLDQSLRRMGLDYVDIFYSHRPDPGTPLEETMAALDHAVRSGKALYAGISSYDAQQTAEASRILRSLGTPCLIHQPAYNILNRWIEQGVTDVLRGDGIGCIAFCPLAQGLLTNRYLGDVPADSRAAKAHGALQTTEVDRNRARIVALDQVAKRRGQTLAQMALQWVIRDPVV